MGSTRRPAGPFLRMALAIQDAIKANRQGFVEYPSVIPRRVLVERIFQSTMMSERNKGSFDPMFVKKCIEIEVWE